MDFHLQFFFLSFAFALIFTDSDFGVEASGLQLFSDPRFQNSIVTYGHMDDCVDLELDYRRAKSARAEGECFILFDRSNCSGGEQRVQANRSLNLAQFRPISVATCSNRNMAEDWGEGPGEDEGGYRPRPRPRPRPSSYGHNKPGNQDQYNYESGPNSFDE